MNKAKVTWTPLSTGCQSISSSNTDTDDAQDPDSSTNPLVQNIEFFEPAFSS